MPGTQFDDLLRKAASPDAHLTSDASDDAGEEDGGFDASGDAGRADGGDCWTGEELPGAPIAMNSSGSIALAIKHGFTTITALGHIDGGFESILGDMKDGGYRQSEPFSISEDGCITGNTLAFIDLEGGKTNEPFVWCPTTGLQRLAPGDAGIQTTIYSATSAFQVGKQYGLPLRVAQGVLQSLELDGGITAGELRMVDTSGNAVGSILRGNNYFAIYWPTNGSARILNSQTHAFATSIADFGIVGTSNDQPIYWPSPTSNPQAISIGPKASGGFVAQSSTNLAIGTLRIERTYGAIWNKGLTSPPMIVGEVIINSRPKEVWGVTGISGDGRHITAIGIDAESRVSSGWLLTRKGDCE